ncbi:hypothetical protein [Streptomyces sp. NPDC051310]|uniref:hypothetical protein n=1 Tax=Streptomyces sp. NPDC051310 TaxID=3365649 RepID=UPI0037966D42
MTFTPRTWAVGETVTAAIMNQEIRDQFNTMLAAWTSYTPTWTAATTNPAIGNGTLSGRYMRYGRTCWVHISVTMGSTTTYGSGVWAFTAPFTSAATGTRVGSAHAFQSQRYAGNVVISPSGTSVLPFFPASSAVSNLSQATSTVPVTWANTGQLHMTFTYETT